jgi:ketopantoate hydroxymethyltransferase
LVEDTSLLNEQLRGDASALQDASVFSIVFTRVPAALAAQFMWQLKMLILAGGGAGDARDG